jgi:hypothetical protein
MGSPVPNTSSGVGNADSGKGAPYQDAYSNTIADFQRDEVLHAHPQ